MGGGWEGKFDFLFGLVSCFGSKNVLFRGVKLCFFITFIIVISLILPENFIEILQVAQKIWRFSSSILTIFINFSDFLTFPCYKETKDIDI